MVTVKIPALFYKDHLNRGCGQTGKELGKVGLNQVLVSLDDEAFKDLLSDADCYADMKNSREDYSANRALVDSAIRTLKILKGLK